MASQQSPLQFSNLKLYMLSLNRIKQMHYFFHKTNEIGSIILTFHFTIHAFLANFFFMLEKYSSIYKYL